MLSMFCGMVCVRKDNRREEYTGTKFQKTKMLKDVACFEHVFEMDQCVILTLFSHSNASRLIQSDTKKNQI